MKIEFQPIGTLHSPFQELEGMPIQPAGARGVVGRAEILPQYAEGLKDLDGFSHIILLYHFHRSTGFKLTVTPFLDTRPRGLFATRAPKRPNAIGMSVVRLTGIEGVTLTIEDIDVLDGTPLLDIKPYVPAFDPQTKIRTGWLATATGRAEGHRSDDRFT